MICWTNDIILLFCSIKPITYILLTIFLATAFNIFNVVAKQNLGFSNRK